MQKAENEIQMVQNQTGTQDIRYKCYDMHMGVENDTTCS